MYVLSFIYVVSLVRLLYYVLGTDVPLRINCTNAFLPSSLSGASICMAPRTSFLSISKPRDLAWFSRCSGTYDGITSSFSAERRNIGGSDRGIEAVAPELGV